ncbi:MAG: PEP-CTERM sorting domain-containing protein [Phycisphaerae bacterium]|nr:PEP-CTERM sorting domain-containing protein [Phycisphaerae bacterium]
MQYTRWMDMNVGETVLAMRPFAAPGGILPEPAAVVLLLVGLLLLLFVRRRRHGHARIR